MSTENRRQAFTVVVNSVGYSVGLAVEGEPGYTPCPHELMSLNRGEVEKHVAELNASLNLSEHEAWEIVASTMHSGGAPMSLNESMEDTIDRLKDELQSALGALVITGRDKDILKAREAALTRELEAYKKAKAENDERFMLERDKARHQRDALLTVLKAMLVELPQHQAKTTSLINAIEEDL